MGEYVPKILIIDDISDNLVTLRLNLRSLNVDVIAAQSGKEALIQVKQTDFAVMIIDIQMPDMNGFQTAERIRQGRRNRHTPIIFLTAIYQDQNSVYKGYRSGAVDYITKPFNREILLSKVRVFLELDRIKNELSDSKQQFQSIVQDQTDLICHTDKDLKINFVNHSLLVAFSKTFEILKGQRIITWVDDDDKQNVLDALKALTPIKAVVKLNHRLNLSLTQQIMVSSIIRALFDSDFKLTGYQMVMRDITTEEKSKESLAEAKEQVNVVSKSRSQFVANMSHEIRTPMNSIIGLLDMLTETRLSDEQREILDVVQHAAKNLLTLLNDIIDLSKLDANQIRFVSSWFSLESLIKKTLKLQQVKAKENDNVLKADLDPQLPDQIKGDQMRIEQVLINLLSNALKFTSNGTVELKLTKESEDKNKVNIKFLVSDTGLGIKDGMLANIFSVYDQGNPEIARKFGGSGLGLAISQSLCTGMGGKIEVESTYGKGSKFWFTLPFEYKSVNHQPAGENIHILVVEDNLLNQKVLGTMLQRNGFTFDIAENGKIALEKFKSGNFKLIIMDVQMPEMDGYEATRLIREYEQEIHGEKKTSIIALTANATKEDQRKCLEAGMDNFMTKPFRLEELNKIIEKLTG